MAFLIQLAKFDEIRNVVTKVIMVIVRHGKDAPALIKFLYM